MKILRSHADRFEQAGIDEAYLDISNQVKDFAKAEEFAEKLMEEILNKEDLTCSIGVAPNKMVAKIASDYRKPYGLTAVKEEDVLEFLFPLKVRALPGVGPKTERRLKELKIETIRDLAAANPEMLTRLFGVWGFRLHEFAHGIDYGEVKEERETKSIGREVTFEKDADDEDLILDALDELAKDVHEEVIGSALQFKTITIKVRYQHFDTHTRAKSLLFPTNDLEILKNNAKRLISPFLRDIRWASIHGRLRHSGCRPARLARPCVLS